MECPEDELVEQPVADGNGADPNEVVALAVFAAVTRTPGARPQNVGQPHRKRVTPEICRCFPDFEAPAVERPEPVAGPLSVPPPPPVD